MTGREEQTSARPRALVVRSGAVPGLAFPRPKDPSRLEVVEKFSHTVAELPADLSALDEPAEIAIFTSQIAVRFLLGEPERARLFRAALQRGKVIAVGESTAETLRSLGVEPQVVAGGSGASVLDRLPARLDRVRILLPRGNDATRDLPEALAERGAHLEPIVLYSKTPRPRDPEVDHDIVDPERRFAVFFTGSPSAAQWLFHGASEEAMVILRETPAVVLGRFTERYLESHGVVSVRTAPEASFASALEILEDLAAAPRPA